MELRSYLAEAFTLSPACQCDSLVPKEICNGSHRYMQEHKKYSGTKNNKKGNKSGVGLVAHNMNSMRSYRVTEVGHTGGQSKEDVISRKDER